MKHNTTNSVNQKEFMGRHKMMEFVSDLVGNPKDMFFIVTWLKCNVVYGLLLLI